MSVITESAYTNKTVNNNYKKWSLRGVYVLIHIN